MMRSTSARGCDKGVCGSGQDKHADARCLVRAEGEKEAEVESV